LAQAASEALVDSLEVARPEVLAGLQAAHSAEVVLEVGLAGTAWELSAAHFSEAEFKDSSQD
jgi:hypothetical protein